MSCQILFANSVNGLPELLVWGRRVESEKKSPSKLRSALAKKRLKEMLCWLGDAGKKRSRIADPRASGFEQSGETGK